MDLQEVLNIKETKTNNSFITKRNEMSIMKHEDENYKVITITKRNGKQFKFLIDSDLETTIMKHKWSVLELKYGSFYLIRSLNKKNKLEQNQEIYLHSFILKERFLRNESEEDINKLLVIDHINNNHADNRTINLRQTKQKENILNSKKASTPFNGIYYNKRAKLYLFKSEKQNKHLSFKREKEAVIAKCIDLEVSIDELKREYTKASIIEF